MPNKIQKNSSELFFLPENTSGRLYDKRGVSNFTISRDSVYLMVDESSLNEVGLVIESGEIAYFDKNKIFSVK